MRWFARIRFFLGKDVAMMNDSFIFNLASEVERRGSGTLLIRLHLLLILPVASGAGYHFFSTSKKCP